jgi:hypothetical protein
MPTESSRVQEASRLQPDPPPPRVGLRYNIDYIDVATIDKVGIQYPVLIPPPTDRINLSTYRKIEEYSSSGSKAIALGKHPSLAPGLLEQDTHLPRFPRFLHSFSTAPCTRGFHVDSLSDLPEALHQAVPPDLATTGEMSGIGFLHRTLPTSDIYFVANTSNTPIRGTIHFRPSRPVAESWNPDTAVANATAQKRGRDHLSVVSPANPGTVHERPKSMKACCGSVCSRVTSATSPTSSPCSPRTTLPSTGGSKMRT